MSKYKLKQVLHAPHGRKTEKESKLFFYSIETGNTWMPKLNGNFYQFSHNTYFWPGPRWYHLDAVINLSFGDINGKRKVRLCVKPLHPYNKIPEELEKVLIRSGFKAESSNGKENSTG